MAVRKMLILISAGVQAQQENCKATSVDFIVLAGDATQTVVEDDIRLDLAKVGIDVTARYLEKEAFNAAMVSGDYGMVFSETYGAPYDPHSFVASWTTPDEAHYSAMETLGPPLDPVTFAQLVRNVSEEVDPVERQDKWTEILSLIHAEVLHLPLWGKRIPSIVNRKRIEGYLPGFQQFDYPLQRISVVDGPNAVTIAPGGQTGLFQSVGRLDPHSYRPNEFFSNNWVYEGLVSYGPNGAIEASLATSWTTEANGDGEIIRFTLRENVVFHDGAAFNCTVVELNFNHVFAPPLTTPDYHGWYNLPVYLTNWYCEDDYTFVLETSAPYYPLLQELTYIRPLRMLSPLGFMNGIETSPVTENSCLATWGTITDGTSTVTCVGTKSISGTGPFKYVSRTTNADGLDDEVVFARNDDYWDGAPNVETVTIVRYEDHADVKTALMNGDLDMVVGAGVMDPNDINDIRLSDDDFDVLYSEVMQNTVVIINAAKPPTDDIDVRKVIVHAFNKGPVIAKELGNIEEPVSQLFSRTAPYCDVNLVPQFDYDFEKAILLNCPDTSSSDSKKKKTTVQHPLFIALFAIAAFFAIVLIAGLWFMAKRERAGAPLFSPLLNHGDDVDDKEELQLATPPDAATSKAPRDDTTL